MALLGQHQEEVDLAILIIVFQVLLTALLYVPMPAALKDIVLRDILKNSLSVRGAAVAALSPRLVAVVAPVSPAAPSAATL